MSTEHRTGETPESGDRGVYASAVGWMENLSETQYAYLLLTPAFLLLGVIAFWPLLSTFRISMFADSFGQASVGNFIGIGNYVAIITGERTALLPSPFLPEALTTRAFFNSALAVTVIFTVISVFFETLIGFVQALVLDQDFRGRRWVRVAIILPWAIPIVVQGMIFYLMFQPNVGFLVGTSDNPAFLNQLGLLSTTPLANAQDATMIAIVADVWKTTAFMALLILAGMQSIDRGLYDVAKVAGASAWQRFKYVTFPIILPTVMVAMLFRTIQAMRVYGLIETVAGCTTVPSLSCLVVTTFNNRMLGSSATIAFITAAIIAVAVSVYIVGYVRGGQ
ncbi:carbohydrate ABC transporter permease [Halobellus limi]|jgi:multiple sugar transport system permease protein|uniref:Multiple sugar transport system permease protein n=1 Tax=Halobellus limi TaxID=699433 RepID=A0A1H6C3Q4_9EURY|nr:sugar ABC transporter permease [Halobellus limi]SEG67562.1 multiple sugar transport system permease protein [Halobellus limi]